MPVKMEMAGKIILVAILIQNSFGNCRINSILENKTKSNITRENIEKWLHKPLQDIPDLHIKIRSTHYIQDMDNAYVRWFVRQTKIPIKVSTFEPMPFGTVKPEHNRDNYAIVANMSSLHSTVQQFIQRAGNFFFIVNDEINFKELYKIFNVMWKDYLIFKNFLLTIRGVLIYDPFAINRYGEYGSIVEYTGEFSMERLLFYDMRGYPLRVQLFKSAYSKPSVDPKTNELAVEGVDGRVADLLQQQMNFTMNLQEPNPNYFGERDKNGSYNGVIGAIIKNELDLCLTGFFVKDYMVPEMDFSVAVYDDMLCIYVPKAKRIPESILPILSVKYDIWLGFICTAFVCATIWLGLRKLNQCCHIPEIEGHSLAQKQIKWQMIRILIDTWVIWVRVNITKFPPFNSERVFIASLCLVSVIFGAVFESSLATVYIHPMYYNDIHTMEELDESGLHVIYKYTSMGDDLFFSETSPLFASLNKKLRHWKDLNADVMEDVAVNADKASVTRYTTLMLESVQFISSKRIYIVPECPKYYTISYVWPKDVPWDETVNQLLLRFQNAGLFQKYINDMETDVDMEIMRNRWYDTAGGFKVLKLEDLQLAFYVVLIGCALGFTSLFIEMCQKDKTKNKIHQLEVKRMKALQRN